MNTTKVAVVWFIISIIVNIFIVNVDASPAFYASFMMLIFATVVATIIGFICAMLGDCLRRFALPDAIWVSGGFFEIIKTKLFWLFGPQIIGLFIGSFIGYAIILY